MTGTSTEKLRSTLIARTPATQRVIIWTSLCEVDDAELSSVLLIRYSQLP